VLIPSRGKRISSTPKPPVSYPVGSVVGGGGAVFLEGEAAGA
jgi:hypothetical protein